MSPRELLQLEWAAGIAFIVLVAVGVALWSSASDARERLREARAEAWTDEARSRWIRMTMRRIVREEIAKSTER